MHNSIISWNKKKHIWQVRCLDTVHVKLVLKYTCMWLWSESPSFSPDSVIKFNFQLYLNEYQGHSYGGEVSWGVHDSCFFKQTTYRWQNNMTIWWVPSLWHTVTPPPPLWKFLVIPLITVKESETQWPQGQWLLIFVLSSLGLSHHHGHCVVFLGKTLNSHSISLLMLGAESRNTSYS